METSNWYCWEINCSATATILFIAYINQRSKLIPNEMSNNVLWEAQLSPVLYVGDEMKDHNNSLQRFKHIFA